MSNKLYEEISVKNIADALRARMKEYYKCGDGTLLTDDTNSKNFDGMMATSYKTGSAGYNFENDFKIADMGPNLDKSQSPYKDKLGLLNLVSRLGFPDDTSMTFTMTNGTTKYAPDNGWIVSNYNVSTSTASTAYIRLQNKTAPMMVKGEIGNVNSSTNGGTGGGNVSGRSNSFTSRPIYTILPCSRLDKIYMETNITPTSTKFIPAKKTNTSNTDKNGQYGIFGSYSKITPTSGTVYRAENDGFIVCLGTSSSTSYYYKIEHVGYYASDTATTYTSSANGMVAQQYGTGMTNGYAYCFMPIARNSAYKVTYSGSGTIYFLKAHN